MTAPTLHYIGDAELLAMIRVLCARLREDTWHPQFIVGIGRGGLIPAVYVSHALEVPMLSIDQSSRVPDFSHELLVRIAAMTVAGSCILFVDDINDSGGTIAHFREVLANHGADEARVRFAVLIDNAASRARVDYAADAIDRTGDKRWFVFPWEAVMGEARLVEEAAAVPERLG